MYRHMRTHLFFDEETIEDGDPVESGRVLNFKTADVGSHTPTDLTYFVQNDLDVAVSVQPIGGVSIFDCFFIEEQMGSHVSIHPYPPYLCGGHPFFNLLNLL